MTTQLFRNNQLANTGTPTAAGALVVTPTRAPSGGSGAGGGRIIGSRIAAVNLPLPGPGPGGFPSPPTGTNTPLGNPNWPCAAGPQIQGLTSTTLPIDTGTGYYFRHKRNPSGTGRNDLRFTTEFAPATELQSHMVAFDYYGASTTPGGPDNASVYVEPTRYTLPVDRATVGGAGCQIWSPVTPVGVGAGTALTALQSPGGTCLRMDGTNPLTSYIDMTFDASALAPLLYNASTGTEGSRIVQVVLKYRAWRDGSADPAPGEGFSVYYGDNTYPVAPPLNLFLSAWLVTQYQGQAVTVTKSLGEVNYGARGYATDHATELWHAHPYTIEDLATFMTANNQVYFRFFPLQGAGANQRYLYLDYAEMDVYVIPERRLAASVRLVSNLYPGLAGNIANISKAKWAPTSLREADLTAFPNNYFDLVVREALPVDAADLLAVQPTLGLPGYFNAVGPSLQIPAITQYQQTQSPQLQTFTATIVNGQDRAGVLTPFEQYNLAVAAFYPDVATAGSFWAAYRGMALENRLEVWGSVPLLNYGNAQLQRIWVNGGTTYDSLHMIAKAGQQTVASMAIDLIDVTGAIVLSSQLVTAASINALIDRGNGWKSFSVALTTPYTPSVSGYVYLIAYSTTQQINAWFVSSVESLNKSPFFGYDVLGNSLFNYPDPSTYPAAGAAYDDMVDRAMFLTCVMATAPTPVAVINSAINTGFACDVGVVQWVQLTWTPDATADKYAIQMSTDAGLTWMTMQIVETFGSTTPQIIQCLGAAWDVPVIHRLIAYRMFDRRVTFGAASNSVTLTSGGAVLGFSTATQAFVYSPTDPTAVELQWTDLNVVTIVQLHGEDFNRALRENQDRGLRLTFQAVVDRFGSCSTTGLNTAQLSLDPSGFETIQSLCREEYLTVRFPGGMTRLMTMEIGNMTVRTSAGVYSVTLTLTDVSADGFTFTSDELFPQSDI